MNVITITREYGAGGSEVARKLSEALGWESLDRELLHQAAEVEHVPDADLEQLDEKAVTMAERFSLHPPHQKYLHGLKAAVEAAAGRGNVVLVGRGARHLLCERPGALHLRLVAPKPWRAQRMARTEGWPIDEAMARCTDNDRARSRFVRYFFGDKALEPAQYDLTFNTERVLLDDVVAVVAAIVRGDSLPAPSGSTPRRVLTLSRELGAGEKSFADALGERLAMRVYDRELIEQEAVALGVKEAEMENIDEHAAGIVQRFSPNSIYRRYFDILGRLMHGLADRGDAILVGRGGSRILRDHPRAFRLRLVAPMPVRVRRVMEYRWVREDIAKRLIADSDSRRSRFYESCFEADWTSPLEYDLTVNSGRLAWTAVEAAGLAADRYWSR